MLVLRVYTILCLNMVYRIPIFVYVYRCIRSFIYPGLHTRQFKLLNTASLATRELYYVSTISMPCTYTLKGR